MEINPNKSTPRLQRPRPGKRVSPSSQSESAAPAACDSLEATSFTHLEEAFSAIPEIRQERIEDGRRLARDPEYPDQQQLREVSELIYRSLNNPGDSRKPSD
jgi:hypothetical protein